MDGEGARLYGGRWNPPGIAAVYLAESRALAALEILVHAPREALALEWRVIPVDVPDEWIEPARALDAVPRLQRTRRVIHPAVNHLAVVRARAHARARFALEHADAVAAAGDGQCGGQADHAGADDRGVDGFHWRVTRAAVRSGGLPQRRFIIE